MNTDRLVNELQRTLPPTPPLAEVHRWVAQGRKRPKFHLSVWLSRVCWRPRS